MEYQLYIFHFINSRSEKMSSNENIGPVQKPTQSIKGSDSDTRQIQPQPCPCKYIACSCLTILCLLVIIKKYYKTKPWVTGGRKVTGLRLFLLCDFALNGQTRHQSNVLDLSQPDCRMQPPLRLLCRNPVLFLMRDRLETSIGFRGKIIVSSPPIALLE